MKLEGVYVALVSLFQEDGSLDRPAMERHLAWLAEANVAGFVPCGTTGENPTLSPEDRDYLISRSVETAAEKGLTVMAGCGGNCTEKVLDELRRSADLGSLAALVVTPYYNRPTQRGLIAHYTYLADRSPIPFVLYNVPGRTGVNLLPATVRELMDHPKIIGLKEASGNHAQWLELARHWRREEKALLSGDDDAVATIMSLGGSGVISAAANVAPRRFVDLCELARKGDWEGAFQLQARLTNLVKAIFIETNPAPAKFALSLLGRGQNRLRLPLVPVTSESESIIRQALMEAEIF